MSSIVATASGSLALGGVNESKLKKEISFKLSPLTHTSVRRRDSQAHDVSIRKIFLWGGWTEYITFYYLVHQTFTGIRPQSVLWYILVYNKQ